MKKKNCCGLASLFFLIVPIHSMRKINAEVLLSASAFLVVYRFTQKKLAAEKKINEFMRRYFEKKDPSMNIRSTLLQYTTIKRELWQNQEKCLRNPWYGDNEVEEQS